MRRICFAFVAVAFSSFGASESGIAADLLYSPRPVANWDGPVRGPVVNWTGVYLGGNLGYGWAHVTASATGGGATASGSEDLNGYVAGGQAGVNVQTGRWVWGLEADFQATGQSRSGSFSGGGTTVTVTDKLPWFGTLRARTGYAWDRWLAYVTGGLAYGQFKSDGTATGAFAGSYSYSTTKAGWVIGGGLEAFVDKNWTVKFEYLHLDSGNISHSFSVGGTAVATNVRLTDEILRFGVNYKFP